MNSKREGLVLKSTGNEYIVESRNHIFVCRLRGQFRIKGIKSTNPIAVGDHVLFCVEDQTGQGMITDILERKNYIYRKSINLSKITHVIAANIDRAFLIVSLVEPRTPLGFIDRFLTAAEAFRIPTSLVFNKTDMYSDENEQTKKEMEAIYTPLGYPCLSCSAKTGKGIDGIKQEMTAKVSLFCGQSGVGKSSIINTIEPNLELKTGKISDYNEKGKHTTTFAQMYLLSFGAYIIDTPGIKEFGLIKYEKEELCHYFPEMLRLLDLCKFSNCTHTHEPNCAVKQAVEEKKIAATRYNNYLAIINDKDLNIKDWMLK